MSKTDPVAKELKRICGKLKSAWALRVGFETRLDSLLPAIAAMPSGEIEHHFDSIARGDEIRRMAMVLIATEHLFHPSLHHRIPDWLADESLPYRSRVIRAIGRFRLRPYAVYLNPFFSRYDSADSQDSWDAALEAVMKLKAIENYGALSAQLGTERTWNFRIANALRAFPEFDAGPIYRKWFRESEVIDQIAVCEKYLSGAITPVEKLGLDMEAHFIWDCAERYVEYAKEEVFEFLLQHLNFDQTWFSSDRLSQTIVCRGRIATRIIAKANCWWVDDNEVTREAAERQNEFLGRLWQSLRLEPSLAYGSECPVTYEYPPKHKVRRSIIDFLVSHERVIAEDPEHGFSLRESRDGGEYLLAIRKPHWRFVRLSEYDREQFEQGKVTALELFFRYSSRGALIAFADQMLLNANDLENKKAKSLIRKAARKQEKESLARRLS